MPICVSNKWLDSEISRLKTASHPNCKNTYAAFAELLRLRNKCKKLAEQVTQLEGEIQDMHADAAGASI